MVDIELKLPEGFLDEETRCGYLVSGRMKQLWAVELDLLYQLQKICDKYGIRYFASGGTMLGAVRHKGFIPWDDDIDIMLMRDQYDMLCLHADEFEEPYFFQTARRDDGYLSGHAQLRNSNTTTILESHSSSGKRYNQGIFIDIFPMDAIPDEDSLRQRQIRRCVRYQTLAKKQYNSVENPDAANASTLRKLSHPFACLWNRIYPYMNYFDRYEAECRRYNHLRTERVSKLCLRPEDEKLYQKRTDFDDWIMMDFEMLQIPVISAYDAMLRYKFGDYMQFVQHHGYHGDIFFDTDTSYKEYETGVKST